MNKTTYTAETERADTAFLVGANYSRAMAVEKMPDVLDAHQPRDDYRCKCGEDLFGGSAAYSWQLYLSHVAGALDVAIRPAS